MTWAPWPQISTSRAKPVGQRHGPQDALCRGDPVVQRRGRDPGRGSCGGVRAEAEAVAHQLAHIERPRRLDEGEGRDGRQLEAAPCPNRRAAGRARASVARRSRRAESPRPGDSSTGARASTMSDAKPLWRTGSPKNPAKPSVSMLRIRGLERAAEAVRTARRCRTRPGSRGGPVAAARLRRPAAAARCRSALRSTASCRAASSVMVRVRPRPAGHSRLSPRSQAVADCVAAVASRATSQARRIGQQLEQRGVAAAVALRRPAEMAGILRPAAEGHEQPVEVERRRRAVRPSAWQAAGEGRARVCRHRRAHAPAKPVSPARPGVRSRLA